MIATPDSAEVRIHVRDILRHAIAIVLLVFAWKAMQQWYYSFHASSYIVFIACAITSAILGSTATLRNVIRGAHWSRWMAIGILLLFCLPWGEWIGLSMPSSRKAWTRILFIQYCFLYGLVLLWNATTGTHKAAAALHRLLDWGSAKAALWIPSLLFFCATAAIAYFVYDRTPLVQDSAAHIFQAKIFRNLQWYAPAPPASESFEMQGDMLILHDGRWFAMYLPGFAALLALAMLFQSEWLLCPFLGAASVAIWIEYARRWHGRGVAVVTGILALFSPFLLCMSSTVMIHTPELFVDSAAILLCRLECEKPAMRNKFLLAAVLFLGVATRGFSILVFLFPVFMYLSWKQLSARKFALFPILVVALALGAACVLVFQAKTTGSPWVAGYGLEYDMPLKIGFGENIAGLSHSPLKGFEQVSNNILGLNYWLSGWYSGSLFLLLLFLAKEPLDPWDKLLLLCCVLLICFYFFYVIQDLVLGPRFLYPLAPVLLLFISRIISRPDSEGRKALFAATIAFLSALPLSVTNLVGQYDPTGRQAGSLESEIREKGSQKLLAFLDRHISQDFTNRNDPFLKRGVILCRDLGPEKNVTAMQRFPGHTPAYFRLGVSMQKISLKTAYTFQPSPDPNPPGFLSLFDLANAMQTANSLPDQDYFDVTYADMFVQNDAGSMLEFLKQLGKGSSEEPEYKRKFKSGLIHSARLAILPVLSFEQHKKNWLANLDFRSFSSEYQSAVADLSAAGETGKALLEQLHKVGARIDRNSDGKFSEAEITHFAWTKRYLLLLE